MKLLEILEKLQPVGVAKKVMFKDDIPITIAEADIYYELQEGDRIEIIFEDNKNRTIYIAISFEEENKIETICKF